MFQGLLQSSYPVIWPPKHVVPHSVASPGWELVELQQMHSSGHEVKSSFQPVSFPPPPHLAISDYEQIQNVDTNFGMWLKKKSRTLTACSCLNSSIAGVTESNYLIQIFNHFKLATLIRNQIIVLERASTMCVSHNPSAIFPLEKIHFHFIYRVRVLETSLTL